MNFTRVFALLLAISSGAFAAEWKGSVTEKDGIRHIVNPGTPMEAPVDRVTTEVWRRGGEDDDLIFGTIGDVVVDSEGRTYLLDVQLNQVHVIDAGGNFLKSIGRSGEGPGEFRNAVRVGLFSDGTVCVVQAVPGRVVLLTPAGDAAGDQPIPRGPDGGIPFVNGGTVAGDHLVLYLAQLLKDDNSFGLQSSFVRVGRDGNVTATYWELLQEQDFSRIVFDEKADAPPVWAAGPDGRVYVNNDWDQYGISVYGPDGPAVHVIEREYAHLGRSAIDFKRIQAQMDAKEISADTEVAQTLRDVARILPREDGVVWILSSRGARDIPVGTIASFDVFDADGRFVRAERVQGMYRPTEDAFFLAGDRVFIVTGASTAVSDEATDDNIEPNQVVCLKIVAD